MLRSQHSSTLSRPLLFCLTDLIAETNLLHNTQAGYVTLRKTLLVHRPPRHAHVEVTGCGADASYYAKQTMPHASTTLADSALTMQIL